VSEGLRVAPFLRIQRRRNASAYDRYFDCGKCMRQNSTHERQMIGCGFEPRVDGAAPCPLPGFEGRLLEDEAAALAEGRLPRREPSVCPGFSCGLPEVIETTHAHFWKGGELMHFTRGELATPALLAAITEYQGALNEAESWEIKNPEKRP
jgi:hypothetical protein